MGSDKERSRRRVKRTTSDDALDSFSQRTDMRKVMEKQRAESLRNLAGPPSQSRRPSKKSQVDDYDLALAKVRARFDSGGKGGDNKNEEKADSRKQKHEGSQSRQAAVPKNYEDALAKVAARFSMSTRKSGSGKSGGNGPDLEDNDRQNGSQLGQIPNNYEEALAKVASRFSTSDSGGGGKETKRRRSKKKADIPSTHADALAKVAARFADTGRNSFRRLSRRNLNAKEKNSQEEISEEEAIAQAAGSFGDDPDEDNQETARVADTGTSRRGSSRRLSRRNLMANQGADEDSGAARGDRPSVDDQAQENSRPRYSRQSSFDSTDEDRAIAEAVSDEVSTHNRASNKREFIDEPTRKVERRGSDSSIGLSASKEKEKRKGRGGGIRRTTSDELQTLEFAERAENGERVKETQPAVKPALRSQDSNLKKNVMFVEDANAKHGVYCDFLEGSEPLSQEEKASAWYGGRNYKLFKSLCYSESVEAKENDDYCMRFDKVWAACATVSVDFAWQELMKAEHKKTSPNNAVMLAKARCRGFEREIFPETLLRNRLATVKYVVRSFRHAEASLTMSQEQREESVRDASVRCSRPFRRFARLIAEGDSLLVAAWERVKRHDSDRSGDDLNNESGQMDGGCSRRDLMSAGGGGSRRDLMSAGGGGSRRDLMSAGGGGSRRDLMSAGGGSRRDLMSAGRSSGRQQSRRDLMSSFKSSGSARKLLSQVPNESRRNLMKGNRQDSRQDMLMSLKSSGSSRKLMTGLGNFDRQQSRRDLMSSLHSSGSSRHLLRGDFGGESDPYEELKHRRPPTGTSRRNLMVSSHAL